MTLIKAPYLQIVLRTLFRLKTNLNSVAEDGHRTDFAFSELLRVQSALVSLNQKSFQGTGLQYYDEVVSQSRMSKTDVRVYYLFASGYTEYHKLALIRHAIGLFNTCLE